MRSPRTPRQLLALVTPKKKAKPWKRTPGEFARIYGSRARVRWIKSLPCLACWGLSPIFVGTHQGRCHNAHTETGGTSYKAHHKTIVPLCAKHHTAFDEYLRPFDLVAVREVVKARAADYAAHWNALVLENTDHPLASGRSE